MYKRRPVVFIVRLIIGFLLTTLLLTKSGVIYSAQGAVDQPQVLIINAYNQGYKWTDSQTDAIIEGLEASPLRPIYYIEYLDWKRQPSAENLLYQAQLILYKYQKNEIDLIIATDDIGMQFAIDYRDQIAPDAPIVFTAVFEGSAIKRMDGVKNITGVFESIDSEGMMEMILELHEDLAHIYIINDQSETGKDVEAEILAAVEAKQEGYGYSYERLNDLSYDEIDEVLKAPKDNSVLIMGSHNLDRKGDIVPNESFAEVLASWIDLPMYAPYEFVFGHGIVGGSLLSGRLQGEKAVELSLRILQGESADDIQEYRAKTVYYGVDYVYAQKNHVNLNQLTMDYKMINRPISVFEEYRTPILMVIGIIAILSFFIVMLSINIRIRKKAQYQLELKLDELSETHRALTTSDEELKAQNEALIDQQAEINFLAYYDKLTQLPNRNAVELAVKEMIQTHTDDETMVLIVDVDNFNYINTAYGHSFGDELLIYVAKELIQLKSLGYYVGRIAGDEFFIMKKIIENERAEDIIEKIDDVFSEPFHIEDKDVKVSKSIGYSIFPKDGNGYDDLMSRTDMAKKKMKQNGKGMTSRFVASMNQEMSDRIILTRALKIALSENELYVVYQPQYDIDRQCIVGFEALVRWSSKVVGDVSPILFIPLAEDIGEIIDIGYFVLEESLKFLAKNHSNFDSEFRLSVNISVLQLLRQDFIERVKTLIKGYDISPSLLEFEVTESVLIESFEIVNERLIRLKLMGITIALDDFGTGYSSLTYLEKLPISTLKIDKTFIDGIILEGEQHFFTKSIIDIAKRLGFRVVAEGVEVDGQVAYLKDCDSSIIQGYWFSKPIEEAAAMQLYLDHKARE